MTGVLRAAARAAAMLMFGTTLAVLASPARAQETLPTAAEILQRYHDAVGTTAFAKISSLHSTGELAVPAAGITGTIEIWQARPNRTQMHAVLPGFGDVRTGYTGTSGWSIDPSAGARVLVGLEAAQASDDAHFDSHLRPAPLIDSMTVIERTTLSGYDCYKVRTVWKSGRATTDCYSTQTGLLVGSTRADHGDGSGAALILFEEYREFGGARIPTRITTRVDGVDQIITLHDVTLNEVPDSAFVPPADVIRLIRG